MDTTVNSEYLMATTSFLQGGVKEDGVGLAVTGFTMSPSSESGFAQFSRVLVFFMIIFNESQ